MVPITYTICTEFACLWLTNNDNLPLPTATVAVAAAVNCQLVGAFDFVARGDDLIDNAEVN
jgi:hypothetical protein